MIETVTRYLQDGFSIEALASDRDCIEVRLSRRDGPVRGVTLTFTREDAARLLLGPRRA